MCLAAPVWTDLLALRRPMSWTGIRVDSLHRQPFQSLFIFGGVPYNHLDTQRQVGPVPSSTRSIAVVGGFDTLPAEKGI